MNKQTAHRIRNFFLVAALVLLVLIAIPSETKIPRSAPNINSVTYTVIDDFKSFQPVAGTQAYPLVGFTKGWKVDFSTRTTANNIVDEFNTFENGLNLVAGGSRKAKLISFPLAPSPGLPITNKNVDYELDSSTVSTAYGNVDGNINMNVNYGSVGAILMTYDGNGNGLGLNLSKASSLEVLYYTYELARGKPSVITLELVDSSNKKYSKTITYNTNLVVNGLKTDSFNLNDFKNQVDLRNIFSVSVYVEGSWSQDFAIDLIRINANPYRISGSAKMRGTNIPVSGALVSGTIGSQVLSASSDNLGNYTISDVGNGSYSMSVAKPGYKLVGTNFNNPVVVSGLNRDNINFEFDCVDGYSLQGGECLPAMTIDASDGTFIPYVKVQWFNQPSGSTCTLKRKEVSGVAYETIATNLTGSPYDDTSATPGVNYLYQVFCGSVASDENEGYRLMEDNACPSGTDCLDSDLEPSACASANGFLNQVNIASVINRGNIDLNLSVEYRDLEGIVRGSTSTRLTPFQKMDFIVNDLGLVKDTYGTVCVITDATSNGAWSGGLTLYKADERNGVTQFGDAFDFVLYYPYRNPQSGTFTQPLNTNHFGVRADGTVANWIRVTDAVKGDGEKLQGVLIYTDASGTVVNKHLVNIPDGGRFDFSGHEAIGTVKNLDNVGMVKFIPNAKSDGSAARYYMSTGRYFYDCVGATCNNFYTAFLVPMRPATDVVTSGGISTVNGEVGVIELNNSSNSVTANLGISSYSSAAVKVGDMKVVVSPNGTRHLVVNKNGTGGAAQGLLENNSIGGANISAETGSIAATTIFYKLNSKGVLEYAYASLFAGASKQVLFAEFNSFIGNTNVTELFNSSDNDASVQLQAIDASNKVVFTKVVDVKAHGTVRETLIALPKDTYGTLLAQSTVPGISFRNYVRRDDYVIAYRGN